MTLEEIISNIRNKIYHPIYLFMGDEPYYIDNLSDFIQASVLDESEKAFNEHIVYGKDTNAKQIDNLARRFPMMANHQLVIVKEAQEIKGIDELLYYCQGPLKSTILVINYKYKSLRKNSKLYKAIQKVGVVYESKKKYESEIPSWIISQVRKRKAQIEPEAAQLLTENLGTDLSKISNEIEKLVLSLPADKSLITNKVIEQNIGISKDFNNFELQKALGKKDSFKVNQIVRYFADNQKSNPFTLTLIVLFSYFQKILLFHYTPDKQARNIAATLKINPYFVKEYRLAARNYSAGKVVQIISLLRVYDLKSKGVDASSIPPGELLRELVFKILH